MNTFKENLSNCKKMMRNIKKEIAELKAINKELTRRYLDDMTDTEALRKAYKETDNVIVFNDIYNFKVQEN